MTDIKISVPCLLVLIFAYTQGSHLSLRGNQFGGMSPFARSSAFRSGMGGGSLFPRGLTGRRGQSGYGYGSPVFGRSRGFSRPNPLSSMFGRTRAIGRSSQLLSQGRLSGPRNWRSINSYRRSIIGLGSRMRSSFGLMSSRGRPIRTLQSTSGRSRGLPLSGLGALRSSFPSSLAERLSRRYGTGARLIQSRGGIPTIRIPARRASVGRLTRGQRRMPARGIIRNTARTAGSPGSIDDQVIALFAVDDQNNNNNNILGGIGRPMLLRNPIMSETVDKSVKRERIGASETDSTTNLEDVPLKSAVIEAASSSMGHAADQAAKIEQIIKESHTKSANQKVPDMLSTGTADVIGVAETKAVVGTTVTDADTVNINLDNTAMSSVDVNAAQKIDAAITPLVDASVVAAPDVVEPFVDTLTVVDTPIVDMPVVDTPVVDSLLVDTPAVDSLIVDTPVVESLIVDTPAVDSLIVDTPAVDSLIVDTPVVDSLIVDKPVVDSLIVDTPAVDSLIVDKPVVDTLIVDTPVVDSLIVDTPVVDSLIVDKPVVDSLIVDKPVVDTLIVHQPVVDTLIIDKPVVDSLIVDKPAVDSLIVDKPVVDSLLVDTPVVDSLIVDTPVVDTPVIDTPVVEGQPITAVGKVDPAFVVAKVPAVDSVVPVEAIATADAVAPVFATKAVSVDQVAAVH